MRHLLVRSLLRLLWWVFAVSTVAAAVLVSVVRLMLPELGQYRDDIQRLVSTYLGQPVVIRAIKADWIGWTPELQLDDISLLQAPGGRAITRFQRADVGLDLLASLRQLQFVPGRLSVSGVQISLVRNNDGEVTVEGVANSAAKLPSLRRNALAYWLQQQRNLIIGSAQITWIDHKTGQPPLVFRNVSLTLRSDGPRHQFSGSAELPGGMGRTVNFALDARGDLLTPNWSGKLYLEASKVNLSVVREEAQHFGFSIAGGTLGFRLWTNWHDAVLKDSEGEFTVSGVDVGTENDRLSLDKASGQVGIRRSGGGGWQVAIDKLRLVTQNGAWPQTHLEFAVGSGTKLSSRAAVAHISYLRIADLLPLALKALPDFRATLLAMQPQGRLHSINFRYRPSRDGGPRYSLSADFSGLSGAPAHGIPGFQGLSGNLVFDADHGTIKLQSKAAALELPAVFTKPIPLARLAGTLDWKRDGNGWDVTTKHLSAGNSDLAIDIGGGVHWTPGKGPVANLIGHIGRGNLEHLTAYLPTTLPTAGRAWLSRAITAGTIESGGLVLRGPLDQFPFDQRQGKFEVHLNISDGILDYAPHWPRLEEVAAEVNFEGRSVSLTAMAGKIFSADLVEAKASIPDLESKHKYVQIEGRLKGQATDAVRFLRASPLQRTLGRRLKNLDLRGDIGLALALEIPLFPGGKPHSSGTLTLQSDAVTAKDLGIDLTALKGSVKFSNTRWTGRGLQAQFDGLPVSLEIAAPGAPGEGSTTVTLHGHADSARIAEQIRRLGPGVTRWLGGTALAQSISGETDWQATLSIPPLGSAETAPEIAITSELRGLAVSLPAPLGKPASERRTLSLRTRLGGNSSRTLHLRYGTAFEAALTLTTQGELTTLRRAVVAFGAGTYKAPAVPGIWVGGDLKQFSLSAWTDYLSQHLTTVRSGTEPPPIGVDVRIRRLEVLGQWLNDVVLAATRQVQDWQLKIDSKDAAGTVQIPTDLAGRPIKANLARLHLARPPDTHPPEEIDPRKFPGLAIQCKHFSFQSVDLGQMELVTHPQSNGLHLDKLSFSSPNFDISARGDWIVQAGTQRSDFHIDAHAAKLAKLLTSFGYANPAIEGGATVIAIQAGWPGTPENFSLERLTGTLRLNVEEGRLLDVENPAAGRLFGLLSLQTLPRRLSLDFEDLYKKGLSFDRIGGTFSLENGNAYTNDLVMEGPSSRISVSGRTGLVDQDYDQRVTVTPKLASTLPVASALFGPAGIGVGAVLLLAGKVFKGLPQQVDKILSHQYTITGSWKNPVIKRVQNNGSPSPYPANGQNAPKSSKTANSPLGAK